MNYKIIQNILIIAGFPFLGASNVHANDTQYAILDINIGDSFQSVKNKLEPNHNITTWSGKLRYKGAEKYDAKIKGVEKAGRTQFMALFSSPPHIDKMVRAARHVNYNKDSGPLLETLRQQLTSRYGAPSFIEGNARHYQTLYWVKSPDGVLLGQTQAKRCKIRGRFDIIDLNYRINVPEHCGQTLKVNMTRYYANPNLISQYHAVLTDEYSYRKLKNLTNQYAAEKKRLIIEQQNNSAQSKNIDF